MRELNELLEMAKTDGYSDMTKEEIEAIILYHQQVAADQAAHDQMALDRESMLAQALEESKATRDKALEYLNELKTTRRARALATV